MAFTENYAILNDCRCSGSRSCSPQGLYAARFHPDLPPRFGVHPAPRRWTGRSAGSRPSPTYVLHWANAYEDGDEIVLDGFFQGDPEPASAGPGGPKDRMFRFLAQDIMQTRLHRWRMNLVTGATSEEDLTDTCTEFGTHQQRLRRAGVPVQLRGHQRARLVPVQRAGQARHRDRRARSGTSSSLASSAARLAWRRGPAGPRKTTPTW